MRPLNSADHKVASCKEKAVSLLYCPTQVYQWTSPDTHSASNLIVHPHTVSLKIWGKKKKGKKEVSNAF